MSIFVIPEASIPPKPYFPENDLLRNGDPRVLFVN
jgi:hypothetical protein